LHPPGRSFAQRLRDIPFAPGAHRENAPTRADRSALTEPQLPVTSASSRLNRDGSYVQIKRTRTDTLSASEILAAPAHARAELLDRYARYLSLLASTASKGSGGTRPPPFAVERNGFRATTTDASIVIADAAGRSITLDASGGSPRLAGTLPEGLRGFLLVAFQHLLAGRAADLDPRVAALVLHLVGPSGLLNADRVPAAEQFRSPKMLAFDFTNTVERRAGMREATDALNQMGAVSLVTTTISAADVEEFLGARRVAITGYHGGREVRDGSTPKEYHAVAGAYGLRQEDLKHCLAVIGDSKTDAPGDLNDVVFVHNDERTPASALQILFAALDRAGDGSFFYGLHRLTDGRALPTRVRIGPLDFRVEHWSPNGNSIPVITNLQIRFTVDALAQALTARPEPGALALRAQQALAHAYLGEMSDDDFLGVARDLTAHGASDIVRRQLDERIAARSAAVANAQGEARTLFRDAKVATSGSFLSLAADIAGVGDPSAHRMLAAALEAFRGAETIRAAARKLELEEFMRTARGALEAAVAHAHGEAVFFPSAHERDPSLTQSLEALIERRLPDGEAQDALLKVLRKGRTTGGKHHESVPTALLREASAVLSRTSIRNGIATALEEQLCRILADAGSAAAVASTRAAALVQARDG
jgi:hypothetical protein